MTKVDFLLKLSQALRKVDDKEAEYTIDYYHELIDDKIEEGMSEEQAVASLGSIDDIVKNVMDSEATEKKWYEKESNQSNSTDKKWYDKVNETVNEAVDKMPAKVGGMPLWLVVLLIVTAVVWGPASLGIIIVPFALVIAFGAVSIGGVVTTFASIVVFVQNGMAEGFTVLGIGLLLVAIGVVLTIFSVWLCKLTISGIKWIINELGKVR